MKRISITNIFKVITVAVVALLGLRVFWTTPSTPPPTSNIEPLQPKNKHGYGFILFGILTCGLLLIWLVIPPTQSANAASISVIVNGANLNQDSAVLTVGSNTIIAYSDSNLLDLTLKICTAPCITGALRVVDANANAIQMDLAEVTGNPVVAYYDTVSAAVKVATCSNPTCTTTLFVSAIEVTGSAAYPSVEVIGGLPMISYRPGGDVNGVLKVAACATATCAGGFTITTVDSSAGVGAGGEMTIGSNGFPLISYVDSVNDALKIAFCQNAGCTSVNISTIIGTGAVYDFQTGIMTLDNGNPIISYASDTIKVVACLNPTCTGPYVVSAVDTSAGYDSAMTNVTGTAVITYGENVSGTWDLKMARCDNANCTAIRRFYLDTTWSVGIKPQITARFGAPNITYYDETYDAIKFYNGSLGTFGTTTPSRTAPPTNTRTPTLTPFPTCGGFRAVNVRFSADRVLVDLINQNTLPTTLEQIDLNWQTLGGFPSMHLAQMEMNGEVHWSGIDTSPPTSTAAEAGYNPAANRTVPALGFVTWSAQFSNGPASLGSFMTMNDFMNSVFYFDDPNSAGLCAITLNVVPTATPTITFTPQATYTASSTITPTPNLTLSATITRTPTPTPTRTSTPTPLPTSTPFSSPTASNTPLPSSTSTPSMTSTSTPTPTSTSTATPTLTPTATPSNTIITENEFFAAVVEARQAYPDIITVVPDFVPNAINMTIATTDGIVGNVRVSATAGQDIVVFTIDLITVNGSVAPQNYIDIINRDLPGILTAALDSILIARFGSNFNVHSLTITGDTITITLN
jgi:hypothetical protein